VTDTRTGRLDVPGAELYYQVRGTGPLLLIIMGGGGDADASSGITGHLTEHFTVVSYDRRGLSRSTLTDADEHPSIQTHSDDVHRLLAELTTEPAFVLGTSLGAIIGLDLLSRHPEQVRKLVAHEAPLRRLLPDAERAEAQRVQDAIESGARGAQWTELMRRIGVDHSDAEPGLQMPAPSPQMIANSDFFRRRDAPAAHRYELDVDTLRVASASIVAAGGERSRDGFPYRAAKALARLLDVDLEEFPGDHAGFATRPQAFAAKLAAILDEPLKPARV
jgi:pimeloyl-ACP methyl ester carboxylesterase